MYLLHSAKQHREWPAEYMKIWEEQQDTTHNYFQGSLNLIKNSKEILYTVMAGG